MSYKGYESDDEESNDEKDIHVTRPVYLCLVVVSNACKWTLQYCSLLVHFVVMRYEIRHRTKFYWIPLATKSDIKKFHRRDVRHMCNVFTRNEGYFFGKFYSLINRTTEVNLEMLNFLIRFLLYEHINMPYREDLCHRLVTGITLFSIYAFESGLNEALDLAVSAVKSSVFKLRVAKSPWKDDLLLYLRERNFSIPILSFWNCNYQQNLSIFSSTDSALTE